MVGIDIENIDRFKNIDKHFKERVYTNQEIAYCEKNINSYINFAGIWCAKEAVIKALTGLNLAIDEIEILHHKNGAPYVNITDKIKQYLVQQNLRDIHISISHTNSIATAIAMVEK